MNPTIECTRCRDSKNSDQTHLEYMVPLYKSASHIEHLFTRISLLSKSIPINSKVTLILDGEDRDIELAIHENAQILSLDVDIIVLSRNFGVGPALMSGMNASESCMTLCFGSDLQEPQELFEQFVEILSKNRCDIVLGSRVSRDDPFVTRVGAKLYWWAVRRFINEESPTGGFDVFGINYVARKALCSLPELNTNITSQISWIGFRKQFIEFHRLARIDGKSSWTFMRKVRLFWDSLYGFTNLPVSVVTITGLVGTFIFLCLSVATIIGAIGGWLKVPGYATLLIVSALGNSILLLSIGVIGNYLSRAFDNSKGRPPYIVARKFELNQSDEAL